MLDRVIQNIDARREESLTGLFEFLRIPSVSTKPEHAPDLRRCADWLTGQLRAAGLSAEIHPTKGHPIVVARNEHKPGRPTVLFYGHYDVQPPEPLELWKSPPFEPEVREDDTGHEAAFARGAVDDKGQVWCHVEALRAWNEHGGVPVNLIALIEGEEEIGSENFESFVASHRDALRSDVCVVSDTNQFARGLPAITCGLRGIVYEEVVVTSASRDLHSGLYGGAVANPANVLCELLASLHNRDGTINLPGFYDQVQPPSAAEREEWLRLPHDDSEFVASIGALEPTGEAGYSTLEARMGPADLRHQRAHGRLPGGGGQDRHRGVVVGESFHALGAEPRPPGGPPGFRSRTTTALPRLRDHRIPELRMQPCDPRAADREGGRVGGGRRGSGFREAAGPGPVGGNYRGCRDHQTGCGRRVVAGRIRPAGRLYPRPE